MIFGKLVKSNVSLTPHSAVPMRAVSLHTTLKITKQTCLSREAINQRIYIALNGIGTAYFDPRSAIGNFLNFLEKKIE